LWIWGPSWVPYAFDLLDVFSGITRKAKVVWRRPEGMGVKFVDQGEWPAERLPRILSQFGRRRPL
jgi:hypothetical protein